MKKLTKRQMKKNRFKMIESFSFNGFPYMNNEAYKGRESRKSLYFMSPDDYIARSAELLGMTVDQLIITRMKDNKSFDYIENSAKLGSLTIPVLDYALKSQDGVHRAMWANRQGMKKIPVFIFK